MAQDDQMQMGNQTVDTPRLSGPIIIDKMKKGAFGIKLNLLELDILVGVGGKPYSDLGHLSDEIEYHLQEYARPVLLSFMREGKLFHVLTDRVLGVDFLPVQGDSLKSLSSLMRNVELPFSSDMRNYHIYCDKDKQAELHSQTRSILAMLAPPFWIMSQRFFEGAIVSTLAVATAFVVHWMLGVLTYVILCLYVGRDQHKLGQSFMGYRGFRQIFCIAGTTEADAQLAALHLDPELKFIFTPKKLRQRLSKPVPSRSIGE